MELEEHYNIVQSEMKSKCDIVVLLAHYLLVEEFDYLCVGYTEYTSDDIHGDKKFPSYWEKHSGSIKYQRKDDFRNEIILLATPSKESIEISVSHLEIKASIKIEVENYITDDFAEDFDNVFLKDTLKNLLQLLRNQIVLSLGGTPQPMQSVSSGLGSKGMKNEIATVAPSTEQHSPQNETASGAEATTDGNVQSQKKVFNK